jgi:Predicted integral membrane metal-binding protein
MPTDLTCPGCHHPLDVISASGRADDLFVCSHCYHSWFAFELQNQQEPHAFDEAGADPLGQND